MKFVQKEFGMKKEEILHKLKEIKPLYEKEGLEILGLFGSYAKDTQNEFSDIDIAYRLDYNKFSQKYVDGFSKLLRIEEMKQRKQNSTNQNKD